MINISILLWALFIFGIPQVLCDIILKEKENLTSDVSINDDCRIYFDHHGTLRGHKKSKDMSKTSSENN